jgi:flagellar motor component MotA
VVVVAALAVVGGTVVGPSPAVDVCAVACKLVLAGAAVVPCVVGSPVTTTSCAPLVVLAAARSVEVAGDVDDAITVVAVVELAAKLRQTSVLHECEMVRGEDSFNIQTDRQTDRHTDRQTHRHTHRHTHRQTDRHTDRRTDRRTDRQTHEVLTAMHAAWTGCRQTRRAADRRR